MASLRRADDEDARLSEVGDDGEADDDDARDGQGRRHRLTIPTTDPPTTLRDSQEGGRNVVVDPTLMRKLYMSTNESMLKASELHGKGGALNGGAA